MEIDISEIIYILRNKFILMSQIIFGGTVSMLTVATPSTGWIVGYDDDGVLKQKDIFGIITEIGGGLTNPNDLQTVLSLGNDSGANSIIMGTSTYIGSNNGGGKIELDYGGVTNSILISTDNSTSNEHGLILQNGFVALFSNGYNQAIELENGNGDLAIYNINGSGSVLLGVATGSGVPYTEIDEIKISYNTTSTQSTGDYDKQSVFIGTRNSQIGTGAVNTVVIGGQSITATQSDSVYVPNLYIQGGKSIKSTDSNTIFTLNDSGKTLLDRNGGSYDQSWLQFSQDSNYREFIELGVNTDLGYGSQSGIILRATSGPSYSWSTYSVVTINKSNIVLESNDLDITLKSIKLDISAENNSATIYGSSSFRGLEYNDDFSASYSVRSLVDKQYVDTQVLSVSAPNIYTVLNAGNDTDTKSIIMGTGTNIRSGNPSSGGQINLDFGVGNRVLISTDNGGLSTAYVELAGSDIKITSSQFYLEANNGELEIGNNEGLKYTTQQTNLQNRSLIDKEYVDLGTASIWNNLETAAYSPTSSIYSSLSKTKGTINGTVSVGTLPKNIFYEPVSKRMIVVNETSNNVTVINSLTKSVVGTVSVGTQPHGIAFNPNTNDIFISNKGSNNISKFNINTLVISATISVGTFPEGIQYLDNKLYVANRVSNDISVVDTSTNLISATISTSTPKEFTYDSKNNKLWFIGVGPDYVGIIDPTTNTIINSIQVGSNPFNLEYDSNNDRIWVSNNGSTNISVIDTSNNLISATISLGSAPSIIKNNPVDNYMYVSDYSGGQFFEIDTNSLTVTNTVSVGGFSGGLSYNDYTGELYYSQSNLNKVLAYQTVNLNGELVGIGKTIISSEFDVDGTITTTGLRLRNGAVKDYVLTSDGSGRGSWQPRILEVIGGSGLTGSGTSGTVSVAVDFSVVASVSYVDSGTASIWSAISSFSGGLTPSNGLSEVTSGYIGLGGTLSQPTTIDLSNYDLTINTSNSEINLNRQSTNYPGVTNTLRVENKYSEIRSKSSSYDSYVRVANENNGQSEITTKINLGTYSNRQVISHNSILLESNSTDGSYISSLSLNSTPVSVNDFSTDNILVITDNISSKGLVYLDDYSPNFTTYSLVTKEYVDSQVATSTFKYSVTRGFTASIVETITHNLGTDEIIVQAYDSTGVQVIPGTVQIINTNDVDITFSSTLSSIKIVVIG
jgi:YVTN family beta-propeller protein